MILVDANLLIYAVNRDCADHRCARGWLERTLSGGQQVGLAWIVVLAFLRITTHPSIFSAPLSSDTATGYMDEWLGHPCTGLLNPGPHHWRLYANLLAATGCGGNLTSDAHLAALAIEHGYAVYSADNDFKRFTGIRHVNPLALA